MIYPKPQNEKERKAFYRESYEMEKEGLVKFYLRQEWPEKELHNFLVNSLKECYKDEMKEDGLI